MTPSRPRRGDPTLLGSVEDVNGSTVRVKLPEDTAHGLIFVDGEGYRVGQVGSFVRMPSGYLDLYGIVSQVGAGAAPGPPELAPQLGNRWLRVELVGEGRRGGKFERGISQYPSIGDPVHVVTESDLRTVYAPVEDEAYVAIGRVASAQSILAYVDLNRLVSRHAAVVGSTGAGKSTAVASLVASVCDRECFPAARVVLLDLRGEYAKAFGNLATVFRIGANSDAGEHDLHIPFWALTADEFTSVAMGSVSGIPMALLHERLLTSKRESKPCGNSHGLPDFEVTVDTPVPFSVFKLWLDLYTIQCATHDVSENQNQTANTRAYEEEGIPPEKCLGNADNLVPPKFKAVTQGTVYRGKHTNLPRTHIDTLETRLRDPRMRFLFCPGKWAVKADGTTEADLDDLLKVWIGVETPISVFDLSAIPAAVLDDLVGALLRILYDAVYWGRESPVGGRQRPLLIVLEEAHAYLGKSGADSDSAAKRRAARAARRIAKEGRKYGAGLMLVSQRPSEIDPTILSQCGTLFAFRLTNDSDRNQIAAAASDNLKGLFSMLPILRTGEALIVGEAVNIPIRAMIDLPAEERRPDSNDALAVVPRGPDGKRKRDGGWTEPIENEDYKPLVNAWRRQDPSLAAEANVTARDSRGRKKG